MNARLNKCIFSLVLNWEFYCKKNSILNLSRIMQL